MKENSLTKPHIGIPSPLDHSCYHGNKDGSYTEHCSCVDDGNWHGLEEGFFTGVATVAL